MHSRSAFARARLVGVIVRTAGGVALAVTLIGASCSIGESELIVIAKQQKANSLVYGAADLAGFSGCLSYRVAGTTAETCRAGLSYTEPNDKSTGNSILDAQLGIKPVIKRTADGLCYKKATIGEPLPECWRR